MRRQATHVGVTLFAALHVLVIAGPAAVLAWTADKGGVPDLHGIDLVLASLVIGGVHATIVERRLRAELGEVDLPIDAFIAAFNALVVLAMLSSGLLILILGGFAPEHAAIVNHGWPVVGLWVLVLAAAVGVSELVRTAVLRWLEPRPHP